MTTSTEIGDVIHRALDRAVAAGLINPAAEAPKVRFVCIYDPDAPVHHGVRGIREHRPDVCDGRNWAHGPDSAFYGADFCLNTGATCVRDKDGKIVEFEAPGAGVSPWTY